MTHRNWIVSFALVGLLLGCQSSRQASADPEKAKSALRAALTSWEKGEKEARLDGEPIAFRDRLQREGFKLLGYKPAEEQPFGYDLRCEVVLTLRSPAGKQSTQKVVYNVRTSPALSVARGDDD